MRISRDLSRAALLDLVNSDIPIPKVAIKVRTFKHFGVSSWGRDTLNSTSEISGYTSREGTS